LFGFGSLKSNIISNFGFPWSFFGTLWDGDIFVYFIMLTVLFAGFLIFLTYPPLQNVENPLRILNMGLFFWSFLFVRVRLSLPCKYCWQRVDREFCIFVGRTLKPDERDGIIFERKHFPRLYVIYIIHSFILIRRFTPSNTYDFFSIDTRINLSKSE